MLMFKYECWFTDETFGELSKAKGRVRASSIFEAKVKLKDFYPNVTYINISAIIIEESFESDGEWDI